MTTLDYWKECIVLGADECDLEMTDKQLECIADSVRGGHENYDMAFYSPPASDRLDQVERDWKARYKALEQEFERFRNNAETAVRRALGQRHDTPISIGEHGSVTRYDGRVTEIQ